MAGSTIRRCFVQSYQNLHLDRYQIVTILLVFQLISCCNAYFYSEKKSTLGDGDKNCFCQVIEKKNKKQSLIRKQFVLALTSAFIRWIICNVLFIFSSRDRLTIVAATLTPSTTSITIKFSQDWRVCWCATIFAFTGWIWKKSVHFGWTTVSVRCAHVRWVRAKKKIFRKDWRDSIGKNMTTNRLFIRYKKKNYRYVGVLYF